MDHVIKLMCAYRKLVADPAWQPEQERLEYCIEGKGVVISTNAGSDG